MVKIRQFFYRLHWKLTLSYTLVTVAALLVVQILAAILVWAIVSNSNIYPRALIALLREEVVPQIAIYLDKPEPDVQGLAGWLHAAETSAGLTFQSLNFPIAQVSLSDFDENTTLLVLDRDLNYLTGVPASHHDQIEEVLEQADEILAAAASGSDDPTRISRITPNQSMLVAVTVENQARERIGLIVLETVFPPRGILWGFLTYIGGSLIFFTLAAGGVGALFGFFTARGLTRRIQRVSETTDRWSQGDFSNFIKERSKDELGQLTQQLNRMAEQLQNLLHTRQELATLEERNRLARDLHDSVKQQVFATAMQLGTARALIEQDPGSAQNHIEQAERLSRQAQTELSTIISELRPTTLQTKGLSQAIREQVDEWSRLNKVKVETSLPDVPSVPKDIAESLFRLTQEALSNIARHSQASLVMVQLVCNQHEVSISITDNGKGFEAALVEGKGIGLRSMQERIESLGGDFRVDSAPDQGTRLLARCPISKGDGS